MTLLASFIVQNSLQRIQSCEAVPFCILYSPFPPSKNFFGKVINSVSMYPSALFFAQNFTKILRADPEL